MLDSAKRERFQALRRKEDAGALGPAEQGELSALIQEIEDAEAVYLGPATERLRRERQAMEVQYGALEALLDREEALVTRLETLMARLEAQQETISQEVAHLGSGRQSQATTSQS